MTASIATPEPASEPSPLPSEAPTPDTAASGNEANGEVAEEAAEEEPVIVPPRTRRKRRWVMQYLPEEINRVLRDYDAGMNARDISKRHGVSKATLYRWIAQFEGQRTVDDDPGSMRMRIAVLEKTILDLSTINAELRGAADGKASEVTDAAS